MSSAFIFEVVRDRVHSCSPHLGLDDSSYWRIQFDLDICSACASLTPTTGFFSTLLNGKIEEKRLKNED